MNTTRFKEVGSRNNNNNPLRLVNGVCVRKQIKSARFWTLANLFDEMLDGPLASADTPHVIETYHLPLHAEQHGSSVQSHSGEKKQNKGMHITGDVS